MAIQVTDEAFEVLRRSLQLAGLSPDDGGIRLRAARALGGGLDVQVELADAAAPEERVIEARGLRLFVDPSVADAFPEAVLALEPQHEVVVLRPAPPPGASR